MGQREQMDEGKPISRAEKILEAKSAFLPGAQKRYKKERQKTDGSEKRHSFFLFRMLAAGALFLLLISAFHFNLSYHGWNKNFVKETLSDGSRWDELVNQVSAVIKQIEK